MSPPCRLDGRGILVTRPAAQAERLCRLIAEAGGEPVRFPTVEIRPPEDLDTARQLLAERWDLILFVSRNAAERGLALMPAAPAGAAGDGAPQIAAVGKATAEALTELGLRPTLVPASGFDSEALLALPALQQVSGKRVLIVRGEGGRPLLGDSLRARGAEVHFAEVYRRAAPEVDASAHLQQWRGQLAAVTATSDEVLRNLYDLVGSADRDWLLRMPLVVISERGGAYALRLGFRTVAVAEEASDPGIVEALCRLALSRRGRH
jgi:uroporphyrinogen-III synthase